ncbi:hypothetical protein DNTS_007804 [Danionella cerebrum]|uniref:C2H2-type domain-containing protein n=1 Tax=Danionella cerebrum TaxID=2873325 RepID=A0A553N5L8_9TELE|nr:hypothetical protein DNTS_007804 [Danionella translucida]
MQDSTGNILDRWNSVTPEEEQMILRQFLRYGETRSIVEIMMEEADSERSFTTDFISPGASLKQTQALQQPALHMSEEHEPSYTSPLEQQPSTTKQQRLRDVNLGSQNPEPRFQTAPGTRMPQSATKKCEQDEVQILPDGEKKTQNWSSSSSNKCRVKCDACEKTFYDKGTLKIHFNAVHLKIKHRCTIDGCEMMFSSLRSRNRHSANPNPRLHAALERTARPFISRPAFHRENSVSIATSDFMTVKQSEISRGGAKGCVTNQIEVTQVMAKKKKSRKSSTPLKIKQNHQTMLPRQPVNALHGNQPQIRFTNQLCDHKQLQKMLYGCHDISYNDKKGMNDKWTAIWQPMAGVKEET